jgi:hypothetical protein
VAAPGKLRVDDRAMIPGILHVLKAGSKGRVRVAYEPPTTICNRYDRWVSRRIPPRLVKKIAVATPVPDAWSVDLTLSDAFRSQQIARQAPSEIEQDVADEAHDGICQRRRCRQ